ncbi:MAG: hypothetical protein HRT57_04065, partial [Crocinitomicaceae bacterium]|nr:hypothetical protein [Crocinitomicaceae bacterium]
VFLGLFILFGVTALTSCRTKEPTIAKIYVRNAANAPVAGATVIIFGQSTTNQPSSVVLYDTTTTNAAGEAIFNFDDVYQLGQAGVAVLNINVEGGGMVGQGIIKIEQEVTSEETVFIQ